jgi:hypothetical protein
VAAPTLGLLAVAIGLAAVAVWAGANVGVAAPAAAAALVAALAWTLLTIAPRVRPASATYREEHYETLVLLRESFRQGVMGRQAILSALGGLEAQVFGSRRATLSLDEEDRLRTASARVFRDWVEGRLSDLERAS